MVRRARLFGGPPNPHLAKVEEQFGPIAPASLPALDGVRVVFVCYSNRSGSNFLCAALASTGRLNVGQELLNWPAILAAAKSGGHASLHATLDATVARSVRDGWFVLKVSPMHIRLLIRAGILDAVLERACFVHIERADKLAQAISFDIAAQTQAWVSTVRALAEARFDRHRINVALGAICETNHQFDRFYGQNGIVPVDVLYERLVADPAAEVARIGAAIGFTGLGFDPHAVRLTRQAGPLNAAWRERFLADEEGS